MQDQYGRIGLFADASDLPEIETDINSLVQAGVKTPRQARQLQRLMRKRDRILRKQGAREGAAIAASGYASGGYAGGLAGSGIRGMDVIEHEFGPEVIAQHNMQGAAEGLRQTSVAPRAPVGSSASPSWSPVRCSPPTRSPPARAPSRPPAPTWSPPR